jgi:putative hydrolase
LFGGLAGADPWKAATEMATAIAGDGGAEPNLDPAQRIAMEDLARVAELHVGQAAGINLPAEARISAVTRSVWSAQSVAAYRPFFERFGEALSAGLQSQPGDRTADEPINEALTFGDPAMDDALGALFSPQMMSQMFAAIGPMLVSTSAGAMLGHLGRRTLGQYDLPIPRASHEILVVPSNIDAAADDWDVPTSDLRLWVLIHELVTHSVLSVSHVKSRLDALLIDFASAFRPDPEAIAAEFGTMSDLSQLQEMSEAMSDPDLVLSMMRSPAHDLLVPQLDALVAAILGFVDHTVRVATDGLIRTAPLIEERMRERLVDVAPADRFMERLLGLEIDENTMSRGDNFIVGVVERAGDEGLRRLWADELDLPTAAEVDAPGLWLARIGLSEDDGQFGLDVPDDLSGLDDLDDLDDPDGSDG